MLYIAHTWFWLTVSFVLPNHKQFILVNLMLCIAHAFIWLPILFVIPHRKQLIEVNRMPYIAHATKIWTMFDASVIANVLDIFDGSLTPPFVIIALHTVSRRVSDCSVALAASCTSVGEGKVHLQKWRKGKEGEVMVQETHMGHATIQHAWIWQSTWWYDKMQHASEWHGNDGG